MKSTIRTIGALLLGMTFLGVPAETALAQSGGAFAERVQVNGRAVTNWEVSQRIAFMRLLGSGGGGGIEQQVVDMLIEDRLKLEAADRAGLRITEEELAAGKAEFASRAELTTEQFVQELRGAGVAEETFTDFVEAGLAWRALVRARFGPRAQITEAEIDRAMALSSRTGAARVLLSELVLRADTPEFAAQSKALAEQLLRQITTPAGFAAAAREYSVSSTRETGGRLDWLDLANLPPQIASQILALAPGQMAEPIEVPNAIILFQLRALEETTPKAAETLSVDYARFFVAPDSRASAQEIIARLDSCDDLYGVAKGLPEEQLQRQTLAVADLPQDIGIELAKLDEGETTILTRDASQSILMLCGRTPELGEGVDREAVRARLFNQRLSSYADSFLAELKADAIILSQ
ncbi:MULTISPECIES: peptidylprolyl isomerase [Actibacterium]|uniref:Parvulin-like PPIase n=1 Tax=Actibacterium naphthalenivorans TaxID=1614693 RepID=A0A840CF67_9RHOB|nr:MULTISPECIES: peptidylprolyl isomerase [Actibacterium]ALG90067.1 hypothetical protein TQ29_07530 [Actibacterium sp. EMB200-NS6]MBB4021919.1 peptidyl-prolyl cis-trans isomerase SurA [Actibacterium naphthalenivorans]